MKEKIILKSSHPEEYPDLAVECKVIPNDKIGEYLETIPEEKKFYAYKTALVQARKGIVGEVIKTTLKTVVDGREYILAEEENTVRERTYKKQTTLRSGEVVEQEITEPDVVVTNYHSTSNEEYVVKHEKFMKTYTYEYNHGFKFAPVKDTRLLSQVDENVIIMTSWGAPAVCLAGSYIVTYDALSNDYNTIEAGAFNSTYVKEDQPKKIIKKS